MEGFDDLSRDMARDIDRRPNPRGAAAAEAARAAMRSYAIDEELREFGEADVVEGWGAGAPTQQDRSAQEPTIAHSTNIIDFETEQPR